MNTKTPVKRFATEQTFSSAGVIAAIFTSFPKFRGYWKVLEFVSGILPRSWTLFEGKILIDGRAFTVPVDLRDPYQISVFAEDKQELCVPGVFSTLLRDGDFYLDIGANAGWYVRFMCDVVGPTGLVIGMEPSLRAFKSLAKLRYPNFLPLPFAATTENGVMLHDDSSFFRQSATSTFVTSNSVCRYSDAEPLGRSVDHLLAEVRRSPRVMKVDVEGAELMVLKGARKTLPNVDYVLLEVNSDERCGKFGYRYREIYSLMTELGFEHRYDVRNSDNCVYQLRADEWIEGDILFAKQAINFS